MYGRVIVEDDVVIVEVAVDDAVGVGVVDVAVDDAIGVVAMDDVVGVVVYGVGGDVVVAVVVVVLDDVVNDVDEVRGRRWRLNEAGI